MKNFFLLLIMLLATCSYAGSFGISPSSNSPNKKKTASQGTASKAKHKATKHFSLFKTHKRKRQYKHALSEMPKQTTRQHNRFLDWYDALPGFWMHLPLMLLVLVLAGLGITGILLPLMWLWILGFSLYLGLIITIFVLMRKGLLEEEFVFYFVLALIASVLAALMVIGIGLGIMALWLSMAILLFLFLLASALIILILSNFSLG